MKLFLPEANSVERLIEVSANYSSRFRLTIPYWVKIGCLVSCVFSDLTDGVGTGLSIIIARVRVNHFSDDSRITTRRSGATPVPKLSTDYTNPVNLEGRTKRSHPP